MENEVLAELKNTGRRWLNTISRATMTIALGCITITPVAAQEESADSPDTSKDWRIALTGFAGQLSLDLKSTLPLSFTHPSSGKSVTPAITRATGLAKTGSLNVDVNGLGPQKGAQVFLINDSFVASAGYLRGDVYISPGSSALLPVNAAEGWAGGNLYTVSADYYWTNSTRFAPMIGYNYNEFAVNYKFKNFIGRTEGDFLYESFPIVNADDRKRSNIGKLGVRIKLPIQSWYVTPYVQYDAARYFINVRTVAGAMSDQTAGGLLPTNPEGLVNAWFYQDLGAVKGFDSLSKTRREDKSAGLVIYMDYKKFLSLTINGRRNYSKGAWNVTSTILLFVHENLGLMAGYTYAEPEISATLSRSWMVGPVVTFKF